MQRLLCGVAGCALTLLVGAAAADAQETVKVGLIMPYSGQFADTATQMDNGIKLYMKQHGDSVAPGCAVFVTAEHAAFCGLDAQHVKVIR